MITPISDSQKTHQINWLVPNRVLQVVLSGVYTPENAALINAGLMEVLDKTDQPLTVLFDCLTMQRPVNFEIIRQAQGFMHHPMLAQIYVAATDRLVRFAMMVIFNSSVARLRLFDSVSQARMMVEALGIKRL